MNPPFEVSLARMQDTEQAVLKTKKKPTIEQIMKQLANKIEFQWKTLQSAFKALNVGKDGKI